MFLVSWLLVATVFVAGVWSKPIIFVHIYCLNPCKVFMQNIITSHCDWAINHLDIINFTVFVGHLLSPLVILLIIDPCQTVKLFKEFNLPFLLISLDKSHLKIFRDISITQRVSSCVCLYIIYLYINLYWKGFKCFFI